MLSLYRVDTSVVSLIGLKGDAFLGGSAGLIGERRGGYTSRGGDLIPCNPGGDGRRFKTRA